MPKAINNAPPVPPEKSLETVEVLGPLPPPPKPDEPIPYTLEEGAFENRRWTKVAHPLDSEETTNPYHTLGMERPTLTWKTETEQIDVYVDGMAAQEYFERRWGDNPPYNVIDSREKLASEIRHYPFLDDSMLEGRSWTLVTQEHNAKREEEIIHPHHTFGMEEPTLRWTSENQENALYIEGLTTEEFLEAAGLSLHNKEKGEFVLSKRISRVFRPHYLAQTFPSDTVDIQRMTKELYEEYTELPEFGGEVWDGGGVVSRSILERMMIPENASPEQAALLRHKITNMSRVEFTIITDKGQEKGHAMVSDDLDVDFLLPQDIKGDIRLTSPDKVFVALDFIKGKDHMRLDIQSNINLHPFFDLEQQAEWLADDHYVWETALRSGDVDKIMHVVDASSTLDDVQKWRLREYLAAGGHPMHFQYTSAALVRQERKRIETNAEDKMQLPMPGGRYYVMPQSVGKAAGYEDMDILRGEIRIDHKRGTAWVNDEDWMGLQDTDADQPQGARDIWGGADHDDPLWMHVFVDQVDGEVKVLNYRSPNNDGEYVILKPTTNSDIPPWQKADGTTIGGYRLDNLSEDEREKAIQHLPKGDSRKLPTRIDLRADLRYIAEIDHENTGLGGVEYSNAAMQKAIDRATENRGTLGLYCNTMMLLKAVERHIPGISKLIAPMEDVIDAAAKTGASLVEVQEWCYDVSEYLLKNKVPIPKFLHSRLSYRKKDHPKYNPEIPRKPVTDPDSFVTQMVNMTQDHIDMLTELEEQIRQEAMPPIELFQAVIHRPEIMKAGARLNQIYGTEVNANKKNYDKARQLSENYLVQAAHEINPNPNQLTETMQDILLASTASIYIGHKKEDKGTKAADAAAWQRGRIDPETGERRGGIAALMLQGLRRHGIIDEIAEAAPIDLAKTEAPQPAYRYFKEHPHGKAVLRLGAGLNETYTQAVEAGIDPREQLQEYLMNATHIKDVPVHPEEVVLGAMVSADRDGLPAQAVWEGGLEDLAALGLEKRLGIDPYRKQVITYPGAQISESPVRTALLEDVWLNHAINQTSHPLEGKTRKQVKQAIPEEQLAISRKTVTENARNGHFQQRTYTIAQGRDIYAEDTVIVQDEQGRTVATMFSLPKGFEIGDRVQFPITYPRENNYQVIMQHIDNPE